jgi:hypothetical protein
MEFAGNVAFITGGGGVGRANAIGFAGAPPRSSCGHGSHKQ